MQILLALMSNILVKGLLWRYVQLRAVRRRHCVGGGAPVNFGGQKQFFLRITKKFRSILKIFVGTCLVIKALRFADDQC